MSVHKTLRGGTVSGTGALKEASGAELGGGGGQLALLQLQGHVPSGLAARRERDTHSKRLMGRKHRQRCTEGRTPTGGLRGRLLGTTMGGGSQQQTEDVLD